MRQRRLRLLSASAVALLAIAAALPAAAQAPAPSAPGEGRPGYEKPGYEKPGHEKPGHEKKAPPRGVVRPNQPAPHIPPAAAQRFNRPGGRALPGVAAGHLPPRNPVRPPGVAAQRRAAAFSAFRGRQVNVLPPRERRVWREGGWRRESHNGRYGWWWVVDGGWYFYPRPIYPYPTYVSEVVYETPYYGGQFWYYCAYPPGYYPYVPYCTSPWQPVPAAPY